MVGRWANSPRPVLTVVQTQDGTAIGMLDQDRLARESRLDIYPSETEPLDVVVRFGNDVECYGWTNDSMFRGRERHPDWQLTRGVYLAKVTVTVSGRPHVRCFRIHNEGPRNSLRLELASQDEARRIAAT
jgi:hypothetical protein